MMIKSVFLLLFLIISNIVMAQEHEHEHDHHRHEIGLGNSPVYFVNEKTLAYGLHLHYIYNIPHSKLGMGLGYERIFDEHQHNTIGVVGNYRPIENLSFSFSPGITFEENSLSHSMFALHFETAYEFELKNMHLGPVFEVAYDREDVHISLGMHIGIGF